MITTSLFSAPRGFALTADVLLNVTNPAGCHLSANLGLTRDAASWMDSLGARGDSGEGVRMGLDFVGDACWDMPAEQMRHAWVMASYLAEDGTSVSIHEELPLAARAADVWTNRWATLKIVVSADRSVRFLVDEHEVWAPRKKLHPAVLERQRIVMDGQSLGTAGKAYHDALRWHAVGEGRREVVPPVAAFAPQTLPWQAEAWRFIGENGSARDLVAAEDGSCTLASGRAESRQEFARPLAVSFELTPWLQSSGRGADRLRVGFVSGEQFAGVECQGGEIWLADGTGGTSHRVARLGTYAAGTLLALTLIVDDAGMLEAVGSGIIARRVSLRLPEGPWRIYIAATDTTDGVRVRPVGVGSSSRENR